MLTEINFYKYRDGQRKTGLGRLKREGREGDFLLELPIRFH